MFFIYLCSIYASFRKCLFQLFAHFLLFYCDISVFIFIFIIIYYLFQLAFSFKNIQCVCIHAYECVLVFINMQWCMYVSVKEQFAEVSSLLPPYMSRGFNSGSKQLYLLSHVTVPGLCHFYIMVTFQVAEKSCLQFYRLSLNSVVPLVCKNVLVPWNLICQSLLLFPVLKSGSKISLLMPIF